MKKVYLVVMILIGTLFIWWCALLWNNTQSQYWNDRFEGRRGRMWSWMFMNLTWEDRKLFDEMMNARREWNTWKVDEIRSQLKQKYPNMFSWDFMQGWKWMRWNRPPRDFDNWNPPLQQ